MPVTCAFSCAVAVASASAATFAKAFSYAIVSASAFANAFSYAVANANTSAFTNVVASSVSFISGVDFAAFDQRPCRVCYYL